MKNGSMQGLRILRMRVGTLGRARPIRWNNDQPGGEGVEGLDRRWKALWKNGMQFNYHCFEFGCIFQVLRNSTSFVSSGNFNQHLFYYKLEKEEHQSRLTAEVPQDCVRVCEIVRSSCTYLRMLLFVIRRVIPQIVHFSLSFSFYSYLLSRPTFTVLLKTPIARRYDEKYCNRQ